MDRPRRPMIACESFAATLARPYGVSLLQHVWQYIASCWKVAAAINLNTHELATRNHMLRFVADATARICVNIMNILARAIFKKSRLPYGFLVGRLLRARTSPRTQFCVFPSLFVSHILVPWRFFQRGSMLLAIKGVSGTKNQL